MATLDTGRPGVVETEAARLRVRLLEIFWDASGLPPRERRARLDGALQESVAHLEPTTRDRVVERVLEELARWSPPEEPAAASSGGDFARALRARLVGESADGVRLSADEEALLECVRVIVEHLQMVSLNYIGFMKKIARQVTHALPAPLQDEIKAVLKHAPEAGAAAPRWESLKELLHRIELTRNVFYSCARVAAQQALKKLIEDLNPARGAEPGRGMSKRAWEEFERTYEMIEALPAEVLCDRYFSEAYKKEINDRAGG